VLFNSFEDTIDEQSIKSLEQKICDMSQDFQQAEGIILRAIPFRDHDQILSIFTQTVGVIKVLYRGSKTQKIQGICQPLTKVGVFYREKKGEIFHCQELTLVESLSFLRKELLYLEVACDLLQVILTSQLIGKAAPQLYALLCIYLKKIPQTFNPWTLTVSFRLKLLKHDGLAAFPFVCSECQQLLQIAAYTRESEGWCMNHQPLGSLVWQQNELQQVYRLVNCQNYREICTDEIPLLLRNKVARFFEECVTR
jgi:DNA repair protein RecO (recombination protein O)